MAAEEIEALVYRLTGDSSSYLENMRQVEASTAHAAQQVEASAKRIEGFTSSIGGFASTAASAIGALGIGNLLKEAFGNFAEAEGITLKLTAALEANGRSVGPLLKDYNDFAAQMQRVTLAEDDAILAAIQQAESMELTGESAKRAVKNAIALAAAKGGEAASYVRLTAALEQGESEMLGRMLPALKSIKDEGERAAKAQELLAKMFGTAEAEAKSAGGQLHSLSRDFGNLLEGFGEVVAHGIQPIVSGLSEVVAWLEDLDDETKSTITVISAMSAGLLALGPILAGIGLAGAALFNPVTLGIAAVIALAAGWVDAMGGVEEAWKAVKESAVAAWDWIEPVRSALSSFFSTTVELGTELFGQLGSFVVGVWETITGSAQINWEAVRMAIQDAVLFAEFTLRNFGDVASFVWASVKLGFGELVDAFINGIYVLIATAEGLWAGFTAGARFAIDNFQELFTSGFKLVWDYVANGIATFVENFKEGFKVVTEMVKNFASNAWNWIKSIFTKKGPAAELVTNVQADLKAAEAAIKAGNRSLGEESAEAFRKAYAESMSGRNVGDSDLTAQWRQEFEEQQATLGKSFAEFRQQKLDEFAANAASVIPEEQMAEAEAAAGYAGGQIGRTFAEEARKEVGKFDAALAGSAEALQRIADFREKMADQQRDARIASAKSTEGPKRMEAVQAGASVVVQKDDAGLNLLKELRDIAREQLKKAGVTFEGLGLTG